MYLLQKKLILTVAMIFLLTSKTAKLRLQQRLPADQLMGAQLTCGDRE